MSISKIFLSLYVFITKLHDQSSAINNSEDRKLTKTKLHCIVLSRELYTTYTFARKVEKQQQQPEKREKKEKNCEICCSDEEKGKGRFLMQTI